jgi:hypothetical protein
MAISPSLCATFWYVAFSAPFRMVCSSLISSIILLRLADKAEISGIFPISNIKALVL